MTATITNLQVNFITGISAIASWNAVNGVGWYEIRYKPITSSIWITATSGSVSSKLLINLIPNTSYEIQVRGFCSTTNPGAWSSTVTFTTNSQCGVPSGLQLSAQTATTATLNWNSTGAGFYTVRWKNVTQSTWLAATTTTLTKLVTGLTAGQTYEFQVKSHCGNSASSYSSSFVFTAGALPRQASSSGITSDAFIPIYIYPNPTLDELNIDFEATQREQITLKIIDPSGRIIRQVLEESTIGKNHFLLDVHTIANGIYLIELFSNDKLLSIERFIKN